VGARLRYAKVIDRELFYARGGRLHPGLDSKVLLDDQLGRAAAFLLLRGWSDDHGSFTEAWRIESPGGVPVYEGQPREVHLPSESHTERLEDEIADLRLEHEGDYEVVFTIDDKQVARVRFPVVAAPRSGALE
jgi:hypothetical protein